MKKAIIFFLFVLSFVNYAQLIDENFEYGETETDLVTVSSSTWTNHSGGTTIDDVQYLNSGLSYTDYANSGIGGTASLSGSMTGDDNRSFTSQNSGSLFLSALINVSSITTSASGEYFLHFGSTSTHYCKLYAKSVSGNLRFGISKASEGATFSETNFSVSTTYLVILKYTFNGSAQDDRVDLWIISSGVPSTEESAGTPTVENVTAANTDASSISAVSLRQGPSAHSIKIDGIRVATSWGQAPLPVELTSFTSKIIGNTVNLKWQTATEVENYGFDIQRSVVSGQRSSDWEKIGFVHGHGNSNSPKEYSFVDNISAPNGKYFYRLKQIDNDGNYDFSGIVEADFGLPNKFELKQNYPNPFNPSTEIGFALAKEGKVTLNVYNVLGVKVATLLNNEYREAGYHTLQFSTQSYQLPSGIYYYKLESSGNVQVRKMILQK